MTDAEKLDLLSRMYAGEDVCRLQCICADLGIEVDTEAMDY